METSEIKTDYVKPSENPLENMTHEDVHALLTYRSDLLMEINEHYKALVEAIYKLPIHVIYRNHAFLNIDQGIHWIKTAIDNVWGLPETKPTEEPTQEPVKEPVKEPVNA